MSNDNGLEPGWLSREIERTMSVQRAIEAVMPQYVASQQHWDEQNRRFVAFLNRLRNEGRVAGPQGATIQFQVPAQDNRCMDTVARSMTNEARSLDVRHVENIPLGEYEFTYQDKTVRFTISCHTIVDGERLAHVVWDGSPCLGIVRVVRPGFSSSIRLHCRYGHVSMQAGSIRIISQVSESPQQSVSHIRKVEL